MISNSDWCLEEHEGALVEGLQMFVNFESDFEGELVLTDIVSTFSFDTDEKPSDEDHAFRERSAELRLLSISTIQAMAGGSHSKGVKEMLEWDICYFMYTYGSSSKFQLVIQSITFSSRVRFGRNHLGWVLIYV